jgi:hypothetical protein
MKTFALASSSLFFIALASGCPAPHAGEGEGEGEGQQAGEGEGEGEGEGAGEGEGEGAGEGEGEGEGGEGEGEGEGTPITVSAATPFTTSETFPGTFNDFVCFTFTTDADAIYTIATSGGCATTAGEPTTDTSLDDGAGNGNTTFGDSNPLSNCSQTQFEYPSGTSVVACVFSGDGNPGTFTITISEEEKTTIPDGSPCTPNDIAQVCDTAANPAEACLFDGTQNLCAVQSTLAPGDACVSGATTQICDPAQNVSCIDDGTGANFTCQNPDAVRCTAPVDFASSPGGANLFIGQATTRNSAENICSAADGNDLVLAYTIVGANSIVTFEGLGVNSIAVRTNCLDPTTESSCAPGAGAQATGTGAAGSQLFVLIDADPSASQIVVQATESPLLNGGDTCDTAVALPTASGTLTGNNATGFTNASNLPDTGCTGFPSPGLDEFYSITIPAGQTLTASMASSAFDASLYVIDACPFDPTNPAQCLAGSDQGATAVEKVSVPNTTSADLAVFIVADEFSSSETGSYTLTWSVQ